MMFKVGDRVEVKKDLIANTEYNNLVFSKEMEKLKGKEFIIKEAHTFEGEERYILKNAEIWSFSKDMIVLSPEKVKDFKIGDKIKLKKGKGMDYTFIEENKTYTIEDIAKQNVKFKEIEEDIAFYQDDYELVNEAIDHPSHYNQGIEAIDVIESWGLNFSLGNAIKYILRAPHKGKELEDLKKANWYIEREIKRLEDIAKEEALML